MDILTDIFSIGKPSEPVLEPEGTAAANGNKKQSIRRRKPSPAKRAIAKFKKRRRRKGKT